jgi:hypothetical protein
MTISVKLPEEFAFLDPDTNEYRTGGKWLGLLECLLFFASFWLREYLIAGGWLTFKLGAKWAAWQHVIKMPETMSQDDSKKDLRVRNAIGSIQLARFLNGTLFNAFCGMVGAVIAGIVLHVFFSP